MNKLIGCCVLDCEKCDARIATIANDNALREKTAAMWTKLNELINDYLDSVTLADLAFQGGGGDYVI